MHTNLEGRCLSSRKKELKIQREYMRFQAKVQNLELFPADRDRDDLLRTAFTNSRKTQVVFINHGEPEASDELRRIIKEKRGNESEIPSYNQKYGL